MIRGGMGSNYSNNSSCKRWTTSVIVILWLAILDEEGVTDDVGRHSWGYISVLTIIIWKRRQITNTYLWIQSS